MGSFMKKEDMRDKLMLQTTLFSESQSNMIFCDNGSKISNFEVLEQLWLRQSIHIREGHILTNDDLIVLVKTQGIVKF